MTNFTLTREEIASFIPGQRARATFAAMQGAVESHDTALASTVADTEALKDAAFLTLSANAELPNERVLELGSGLGMEIAGQSARLLLTKVVPKASGDFSVLFATEGDTVLALPLVGKLATQEWAAPRVKAVGASYSETARDGHHVIKVTSTGLTVTLPPAATSSARITVKLMVAGSVTIDGDGSETIDGLAAVSLAAVNQAVTLVSDGAGWLRI